MAALSAGLVFPRKPPPRILEPVVVGVALPVAPGFPTPPVAFVVLNKPLPAALLPLAPVEPAVPELNGPPPEAAGLGKLNMGAEKDKTKVNFRKPNDE